MKAIAHGRTGGVLVCALALVIACAGAPASARAAETLYRWVDERGRVTFSQHPPPAGAARTVEQRRYSPDPEADTALPYAARAAAEQFPVVLHTTPDCGATCDAARQSLSDRGVPFREVSVKEPKAVEALKALTGKIEVPALQIGRDALSNFDPSAWRRALDLAGYPASIPARRTAPSQRAAKPGGLPGVKLYVARECGDPCGLARKHLADREVAFQELSVDDPDAHAEFKKNFTDAALPALEVGSRRLSGFDYLRYMELLDAAGFPAARAPKR